MNKHFTIVIYPIIFDLLSIILSLYIVGFYGKEIVSIRLILEMGLPSVSHLSNTPLFMNQMEFLNIPGVPSYSWVIVIAMIVLSAFLQGGYIYHLYRITNGRQMYFSDFLKEGKRHWLQFIILEMILYFGKIAITGFLVIFFGIIGVFAALVFFVFLRIIFIYLEFTIVVDRIHIVKALKRSREYVKKSLPKTLWIVLFMYVLSGGISLLLHLYWQLATIIILVFVYGYVMSVIQVAFMSVLCKVRT